MDAFLLAFGAADNRLYFEAPPSTWTARSDKAFRFETYDAAQELLHGGNLPRGAFVVRVTA